MKTILLTGGAGFIGSHTCISLLEKDYRVVILDSFENSSPYVIKKIKALMMNKNISIKDRLSCHKGDIRDKKIITNIFDSSERNKKPIDAVIHFAGLKSVSNSFKFPEKYVDVNVNGSLQLFEVMKKFNCNKIVYSSSASIYDARFENFFSENSKINPSSPYGKTKYLVENKLLNMHKFTSWDVVNLRYFNPAGAHPSGLIGENPFGIPNNLFPFLTQVAIGKRDFLKVFGDDWPTEDGSCIRDYVHILDLANAHLLALLYLFKKNDTYLSLNIGSGKGTSIFELIKEFENTNKCKIPFKIFPRREGDYPILVANNMESKRILEWEPLMNLTQICKDGWRWQSINPNGYKN